MHSLEPSVLVLDVHPPCSTPRPCACACATVQAQCSQSRLLELAPSRRRVGAMGDNGGGGECDAETLQLVNNGLRMRVGNLQRQLEEREMLAGQLRGQVLRVVEDSENATAHCTTLKHVRVAVCGRVWPCVAVWRVCGRVRVFGPGACVAVCACGRVRWRDAGWHLSLSHAYAPARRAPCRWWVAGPGKCAWRVCSLACSSGAPHPQAT